MESSPWKPDEPPESNLEGPMETLGLEAVRRKQERFAVGLGESMDDIMFSLVFRDILPEIP